MHRFQGADALRERIRNGAVATALRAQFALPAAAAAAAAARATAAPTTTKEEERQPAAAAAAPLPAGATPAPTPAAGRVARARRAAWLDDVVAVSTMLATFTLTYYVLPSLPLLLAAHVRARRRSVCVRYRAARRG
jgi:hypothetical protein